VAYVGIGHLGRPHEHAAAAALGKHPNRILQRIFSKARKLGFEALTVIVVVDGLGWEAACLREKAEIKLYGRLDTRTGCLANLTDGGDGVGGWVPSLETRAKISRANTDHVASLETRRKMSVASKDKPKTEKHAQAISRGLKGKPKSEEAKASFRAANARESTKEKHRQASLAYHASLTDEERMARAARISVRTKERMAELECGKRISARKTGVVRPKATLKEEA